MKLYLNKEGEYVMVGGLAAARLAAQVESRVKDFDRAFTLNVDGLCVVGHTVKDPHGRLAYEWDVKGTTTMRDSIVESTRPERVWELPHQTRHLRREAPQRKPWWKFW